jgi:tRNA-uridine 2-sulfurtransferase
MTPLTAVALSGGVDSMVAAFLLKEQGHEVLGVHFTTGFEQPADRSAQPTAPGTPADPMPDLCDRARRLGIVLHRVDLARDFRREVVDYFTETYRKGETPNPCMGCNPRIKFGALLDWAETAGARFLATGHYAKVLHGNDGRSRLLKGADPAKDQSYFLARLTRRQLAHAVFPLGALTKRRVRAIAAEHRLGPASSEESQDVCFVRTGGYADFIGRRNSPPGLIEDTSGVIVGEHLGLHRFTVGQRRGINRPAAHPFYVVRIDRGRNRLVVGTREELLSTGCRVVDINWIAPPPAGPVRVATRVRYRHLEAPSAVTPTGPDSALVRFDAPQSAVTPGQSAVFYAGEEVLGGGFIAALEAREYE